MVVTAIADIYFVKGALSILSLKANEQATIKEAGKVLAGMLKGNSVLKELDVSDSAVFEEDGGGAAGLAHGLANDISSNGALTTPDARNHQQATRRRIDNTRHGRY